MRKWIFVILSGFLLTSCLEFGGKLTLDQDLEFNRSRDRKIFVPAGEYRAEIEVKSEKRFQLEIEVDDDEKEIKFETPEEFDFPKDGGSFTLTAEQSGQPYDVMGEVDVDVTEGRNRRDVEFCDYSVYQRECRRYRDRNGRWRRVCRCVRYSYNDGRRDVEYFVRTTTRGIEAYFTNEAEEALGLFEGENVESERIYTYRGRCIPRRYPGPRC